MSALSVVIDGVEFIPKPPDDSALFLPPGDKPFATIILRRRLALKWTLKEASVKIGLSQSTLHDMECDPRRPSFEAVDAISQAYSIPLEVLAAALRKSNQK